MITRSGNRPIEKQILRWPVNYLPDKWEYMIERWWYFTISGTNFIARFCSFFPV
jgi:hypothetical protein